MDNRSAASIFMGFVAPIVSVTGKSVEFPAGVSRAWPAGAGESIPDHSQPSYQSSSAPPDRSPCFGNMVVRERWSTSTVGSVSGKHRNFKIAMGFAQPHTLEIPKSSSGSPTPYPQRRQQGVTQAAWDPFKLPAFGVTVCGRLHPRVFGYETTVANLAFPVSSHY